MVICQNLDKNSCETNVIAYQVVVPQIALAKDNIIEVRNSYLAKQFLQFCEQIYNSCNSSFKH